MSWWSREKKTLHDDPRVKRLLDASVRMLECAHLHKVDVRSQEAAKELANAVKAITEDSA